MDSALLIERLDKHRVNRMTPEESTSPVEEAYVNIPMTLATIRKFDADYKVLMANTPRITTKADYEKWRAGVRQFWKTFNSTFGLRPGSTIDTYLGVAFEYRLSQGKSGDVKLAAMREDEKDIVKWMETLRLMLLDFPEAFMGLYQWKQGGEHPVRTWGEIPGQEPLRHVSIEEPEGYKFFLQNMDRYRDNADRWWNDVVKAISNFMVKYRTRQTPLTNHMVPEDYTLEGYPVHFSEDADPRDVKAVVTLLKVFKQKVAARAPWLARYVKHIGVHRFKGGLAGYAGVYYHENGNVGLNLDTIRSSPLTALVHVLIHEMAHHAYFGGLLSHDARTYWESACESDKRHVSFQDVLVAWEKIPFEGLTDFRNAVAHSDPDMAVHLDMIAYAVAGESGFESIPKFRTRTELKKLVARDAKVSGYQIPAHPVSGYGAKNPGETFAEAVAHVVAYGHQTVPDAVLRLLKTVMGSAIRIESKSYRWRAPVCETIQPFIKDGATLGVVYHGGKRKVVKVEPEKLQGRDYGFYGQGFYVTTSPTYAKAYGPVISKFRFKPGTKVLMSDLDPNKVPENLKRAVVDSYRLHSPPRPGREAAYEDEMLLATSSPSSWARMVTAVAEAEGVDAVAHSMGEIVVKDPKVLVPEGGKAA